MLDSDYNCKSYMPDSDYNCKSYAPYSDYNCTHYVPDSDYPLGTKMASTVRTPRALALAQTHARI